MYRFILLIIGFIYCSASAQDPLYISLKEYTLKNTNIDFHVEKVIDARENKDNIGYTQKGAANAVIPVYFARLAEEEFQSLFAGSIPDSEAQGLIIKLDHLYIYELQQGTGQAAYVQLNISFIRTAPSVKTYYEMFQSAVLIEDESGIDVTRAQEKNIVQAVEKSIDDYLKEKAAGSLKKKLILEEELYENPFKKTGYNIFKVTSFPKAVFHSFYDFRDYRPDTARNFTVGFDVNNMGQEYATLKWADDGSKIKDAWGFSDGSDVYIRISRFYYKLTREHNDFIIYSRYIVPGSPQGYGAAGYMFGAVGGLIAGLASSGQSAGDFKCKVNFADGSLIPVASSGSNTFGGIYLYFTSYSQEGNISVFIDDEKKCHMTRDTYYRYSRNDGTSKVTVCLHAGNNKICDQLTANSYNDQVYICKIKKGYPIIDKISSDLQSPLLKEIYDGKYRKSCE